MNAIQFELSEMTSQRYSDAKRTELSVDYVDGVFHVLKGNQRIKAFSNMKAARAYIAACEEALQPSLNMYQAAIKSQLEWTTGAV